MEDLLKSIEYIQGDQTILNNNDIPLNILWGVQPRNLPGLEFLIPVMQIVKFIKAGNYITILLADIHELLDSPKIDINKIQYRGKAYVKLIQLLLELFNVNPNNILYKFGSEFQLSSDYVLDFYKISSLTTIQQTFEAREIDLSSTNLDNSISKSSKKMTTMIYPILQSLDEKYINCDIFYGSITQKPMCKYSEELMKKFYNNDKKVLYLLQDLTKKIDLSFFDPLDTLKTKLEYFTEEELDYLYVNVLIPLLELRGDNTICIDKNKELISELLSKHLNVFYDDLLTSEFMEYYYKGWIATS
jgi:tyrosyl-tRNA synthetase